MTKDLPVISVLCNALQSKYERYSPKHQSEDKRNPRKLNPDLIRGSFIKGLRVGPYYFIPPCLKKEYNEESFH